MNLLGIILAEISEWMQLTHTPFLFARLLFGFCQGFG